MIFSFVRLACRSHKPFRSPARLNMATSQLVQSHGPFQGLPTYPDTEGLSNLTAIVTGANGMSGYHMVRVLAAAPERWSKIYCLSRRPPPSNFFEDLGEGARRVTHIPVDFLADQAEIADRLSIIEKAYVYRISEPELLVTGLNRDYVCFFSYMQPPQEGNILGMWSDAEELARVNGITLQSTPKLPYVNVIGTLLKNFMAGLQQSRLKPKRFLLQTGAKHYGFHIGPATNPSFESDPRIDLEANFYYPQEDALFEYCNATGVTWNVIRPSYIIGAVRDSALNHMVGLSIYASVQAHLNQPLAFPGDYVAWDREYCQSTAMLNGYFEEWALLTDAAANEAFNIQDGLPFTWGRFWMYLAEWYGTTWTPPETDEAKYRVSTSRYVETPRG